MFSRLHFFFVGNGQICLKILLVYFMLFNTQGVAMCLFLQHETCETNIQSAEWFDFKYKLQFENCYNMFIEYHVIAIIKTIIR